MYIYNTPLTSSGGIGNTTAWLWKVDTQTDTIKDVSKWNLTADGIASGREAAEMRDYE